MKWAFSIFLIMTLLGCATLKPEFTFRVMTYNIHHGEGLDGKVDLERIAKLITENKVDLVALQEVDSNTERTGHRDMPAELSRLTGLTNAFGPNIDLQGGQYGNAILSRFPIASVTNYLLPKIAPGEQRGMLAATIHVGSRKFTFASVHLDHRRPEADRLASVDRIAELTEKWEPSVLIAGDFNATPESQTIAKMTALRWLDSWAYWKQSPGFTIPSERPKSRIDYIWAQGFEPKRWRVLKSDASDHLPVVIDFGNFPVVP